MDEQLTTDLDRRFAETHRRFDETDRRLDETNRRLDEKLDGLRAEMDERFDGIDAQFRHSQVMVEDIRSNVRLIAEHVNSMNEKMDRYIESAEKTREADRAETRAGFGAVHGRCDSLDHRVTHLEAVQAKGGG